MNVSTSYEMTNDQIETVSGGIIPVVVIGAVAAGSFIAGYNAGRRS